MTEYDYVRVSTGEQNEARQLDAIRKYGIVEQWRYLTKECRASVVVLDMPLLDTGNDKELTGELISDIVMQLLGYVAETERQFIRQRQDEGIQAAKERGVHFGRPPLTETAGIRGTQAEMIG